MVGLPHCPDLLYSIFWVFLYRGSSAITSWSSTHVLFWIIGAPSVQGAIPKSIFRCCHCLDSNPGRHNLNNKCRCLNDVGHCHPQHENSSLLFLNRNRELFCAQGYRDLVPPHCRQLTRERCTNAPQHNPFPRYETRTRDLCISGEYSTNELSLLKANHTQ